MKTFWKTHPALRIVLMIVLFVLSIALVVAGWKMTGQLAGLGIKEVREFTNSSCHGSIDCKIQ